MYGNHCNYESGANSLLDSDPGTVGYQNKVLHNVISKTIIVPLNIIAYPKTVRNDSSLIIRDNTREDRESGRDRGINVLDKHINVGAFSPIDALRCMQNCLNIATIEIKRKSLSVRERSTDG